jgi:transcription antitermination factor NusG
MHPSYDAQFNRHDVVVFVSDKVMDDYRRVAESERNDVIFLRDLQYAVKPSQAVQIVEGEFAGVVGRIKRVQGKRCVVLTVCDSQAAAIVDVHRNGLRMLTDEQARELQEQTSDEA